MKDFIYLFFTLLFFTACNDGDVLEVGLEFDKILSFCDQSTTTYLVYDTKQNPNESLSLLFPRSTATALIFAPSVSGRRDSLTINGSTVRFNYRTYNGNPTNLLCQLVPDPSTVIINDYEAPSGTVYTTTTFIDDDEDGIPSEFEDINGNGNLNDDDSDGDGIPDYQDADDDNDNVLTRLENPNYSEENGLSEAQDTDGDGVPDYLDDDDDGDMVLTRYEDENEDLNPTNDFDEATLTPDSPPRYLDILADESFHDEINMLLIQFVPNTFKRSYTVDFQLVRLDLQILSTDSVDLGRYKYFATREIP